MKRPNKIERMNAYLYAWAILTGRIENPDEEQDVECVCPMLCFYIGDEKGLLCDDIDSFFPEFYEQKDVHETGSPYWWSLCDKQSRIQALENAITLLA